MRARIATVALSSVMTSRRPLDRAPARAAVPVTPGHADRAASADGADAADIRRVRAIARWLDDRYLDPILGFVLPGAGDVATMLFGLYVLITAVRRRVPAVVLARMILNVGIDALVGAVPVLGDVFDVVFKAHRRNAELLVQRHGQQRGTAGDWLLVVGAALFLIAALAVPIALLIWTISGVRDLIVS
jgi:hypothetical protein